MDGKEKARTPMQPQGVVGMGLKLFLSDLAVILPEESIHHLANSLGFSKLLCERLETSDSPINTMIECMIENEIVTSNSVSKLISALESLEQTTIRDKAMASFQKWSSKFPEKQLPKKVKEKKPEPRKVLEAVQRIQGPHINEEAEEKKSKPSKVLEAVKRLSNSEKERQKIPKPRKVLEAAKRICDFEQNTKGKAQTGKVLEAVNRINASKKYERITFENGKVTEELNRISRSEKAEKRAMVQRKITEAVHPESVPDRIEQDYLTKADVPAVQREHFKAFLKHVDLSLENKLTMKDNSCIKIHSDAKEESENNVTRFLTYLTTGDFHVMDKLISSYTYKQGYAKTDCRIGKRDFLFAILSCCDSLLLQDILGKLHSCGKAVPLIIPSPTNSKLTFLLWGLQKYGHGFYFKEALSKPTGSFFTQPFVTVSALRFGDPEFSKSHILNEVLTNWNTDQDAKWYISREEDSERCLWSEGVVEMTWFVNGKKSDSDCDLPPLSILNLRGDGLRHIRQVKFCVNVSNVIIVFLSLHLTGKYIQEVNQMATSSRVAVILDCCERDAINLSSSDKVTLIFGDGLTSREISQKIETYILDQMRSKEGKRWSGKSLEDQSKCCTLFGIEVDQDNFKEAKSLATKIDNTISVSVDQSKTRVFSHKYSSKMTTMSADEVDSNGAFKVNLEKPFSYTFNTFLKGLSLHEQNRLIFLNLLQYYFDEKSCNAMSSYLQQYNYLFEVGMDDVNREDRQVTEKLDSGHISLIEGSIYQNQLNVDHFWFHLWQLVQSKHPSLQKDITIDRYHILLGWWLLNGNSIDMFGPFCSHTGWPQTVFNALQSVFTQECKVLVLTAFGDTSSSKSRMLKHVFDVTVSQSEIIWSSGIRIQLVSIDKELVESVGFEFILLADVENVKLSEIGNDELTERRKHMCNILSSITDMLLINIVHNCNTAEETAVFNIVVKGILTSTKYKDSIQCCVVYHKERSTDSDFESLEEHTLSKLKDSCNRIGSTVENGGSENSPMKRSLFESVCEKFISKNDNKVRKFRVRTLPSFRHDGGDDANGTYVQCVHDLRNYMLQMLSDHQNSCRTFSEISENISSCDHNSLALDDEACTVAVGD